jgi:GMP synthase (glutamine-hydrolysing)
MLSSSLPKDRILILDYGSQYTQLIARRIREERVYCEIHPPTHATAWVREWGPSGVVLSGGPASVYGDDVPTADAELLDLGVPVLGICYGMQLIAQLVGGQVESARRREYGRAELQVIEPNDLFDGFERGERSTVWMSHGDRVETPPPGFEVLAATGTVPVAAFHATDRPSRGRPHGARRRDHLELPVPRVWLRAELDRGLVHRESGGGDPRAGP